MYQIGKTEAGHYSLREGRTSKGHCEEVTSEEENQSMVSQKPGEVSVSRRRCNQLRVRQILLIGQVR